MRARQDHIHELLRAHRVESQRDERCLHLGAQMPEVLRGIVRLADVGQAVPRRVRRHDGERPRIAHHLQLVVQDHLRRLPPQPREHLAHVDAVRRLLARDRLLQRGEHAREMREFFLRGGKGREFREQELAHAREHAPARQRIEAQVEQPARRERPRAHREQAFLHLIGHPRVNAVRDHVIEARGLRLPLAQIGAHHPRIAQPAGRARRFRRGDLHLGEIHAHEGCARQPFGERQQIPALRAAQLQHARAIRRGCRQAMETPDRTDARRVRLA